MGTSFTSCYASCPICVPSRTTIMTGIDGYESGVVSNADHRAFMEAQTAGSADAPGCADRCRISDVCKRKDAL